MEDDGGRAVDGRVEISTGETRWTFRPEQPWTAGRYFVRLRTALEDRAGNRFDRLFDREGAVAARETPAADAETLSLPFEAPMR